MTTVPAASRVLLLTGLAATVLAQVACSSYGKASASNPPKPAQPCATTGAGLADADATATLPNDALAVYDGSSIPASQYPYVGVVAFRNSSIEGLCTGSLVCSNVVMTAAHCFDGANLGPSNYAFSLSTTIQFNGSAQDQLPSDSIGATDIKVNPGYAGSNPAVTRAPDVAFIRLSRGFSVPQYATLDYTAITVAADQKPLPSANVVGYGESVLGGGGSGTKRAGNAFLVGSLTGDAGTIVTIPDGGNQDTCEGDSGGPLVVGGKVYGVLSGGDAQTCGAGAGTSPRGYYASVPANASFIQGVMTSWCGAAAVPAAAPGATTGQSGDATPAPCQATAP